jgi:hypothetical protein
MKYQKFLTLPIILGVAGSVAGIILILLGGDSWILGVSGSIASAFIAYQGYQNAKKK